MPLYFQHTIDTNTRLGVWKIEETEAWFLTSVPLQREISHPQKRLQHLAGRYLLQQLFPGFPYHLMAIASTRKPFLTNEAYHFSISHCGDYAAAIASRVKRVGIDVELVKPVIEKVQRKFLSEAEISRLTTFNTSSLPSEERYVALLTLCWCAKEAIFKWYGKGGIDFKQHMQIVSFNQPHRPDTLQAIFLKGEIRKLEVAYKVTAGFMLAWVLSDG